MRSLGWVAGCLGAAISCVGIGCTDDGSSTHKGSQGDPGTVIKPSGGADGPGPKASGIALPSQPSGDIAMDITVAGMRDGVPSVTLEISRDGGATFAPASMGTTTPDATPDHVTVVWHSLADVGVRVDAQVPLRLTVGDGQ